MADGLAGETLLDTYDAERRPHSVEMVAHSCDAGRLIDAIAAGLDVSAEAGYGGTRAFPRLTSGFVTGEHGAIGRQVASHLVSENGIDDRLTDGFSLLLSPGSTVELHEPWASLAVTAHELDEPIESRSDDGHDGTAMLIRPDGYVAAATADIDVALRDLAIHLQ